MENLPNLSTILHPVKLQADKKWEWSPERDKAFQLAKEQLTSASVLIMILLYPLL